MDEADTVATATIISKTNMETKVVMAETQVDTVDMEQCMEEDMETLDHREWIIMEECSSSSSSSKVDMEDSLTKTIRTKSLLGLADSRVGSSSSLTSLTSSSLCHSRALPLIPPVDLEDGLAPDSRIGVATGSKRVRSMLGQCHQMSSFF